MQVESKLVWFTIDMKKTPGRTKTYESKGLFRIITVKSHFIPEGNQDRYLKLESEGRSPNRGHGEMLLPVLSYIAAQPAFL